VVEADEAGQGEFAVAAPGVDRALQPVVGPGEDGRADEHPEDAGHGVHPSLAERPGRGPRTIADQPPAQPEKKPAQDIGAKHRGLDGKIGQAEIDEQGDADHGHHDVGEHEFDDGEVPKAKGPELLVVAQHMGPLEEEAEDDAREKAVDEVHVISSRRRTGPSRCRR